MFVRGIIYRPNYTIEFEGEEHIKAALANGKGAVLWVSDFIFAGDVSKIGLSDRGYRVSHLSRPQHGFSQSRFGVRFLNPLKIRFELKYLHERVVHLRQEPKRAWTHLLALLSENRLVSIAACADEGRRLHDLKMLCSRFKLAPGAPALALQSGAALLPVFVLPSPEPPHFRVIVEAAIPLSKSSEATAIETALSAYASRLERYVSANPAVWRGWRQSGDRLQRIAA